MFVLWFFIPFIIVFPYVRLFYILERYKRVAHYLIIASLSCEIDVLQPAYSYARYVICTAIHTLVDNTCLLYTSDAADE